MEFDLDAFNAKYEAEQAALESEEVETDEDEVLDIEDDNPEIPEEVEDEEETNPEGAGDPSLKDPVEDLGTQSEEQKRNTAFAQLRRERDEAKKFADWISQVAEQNGTTPEEMMQRYEQASLQKQAEEKGVPVELLQRMQVLEEENAAIKNQTFAERFNSNVAQTIEKYGATEDEVEKTFQYIQEKGFIDDVKSGKFSFEELHKLAHLDTLVEKKSTEAVQKNLSSKKKRQQEAQLPNGSGATDLTDSLEDRAKADAKRFIENGDF